MNSTHKFNMVSESLPKNRNGIQLLFLGFIVIVTLVFFIQGHQITSGLFFYGLSVLFLIRTLFSRKFADFSVFVIQTLPLLYVVRQSFIFSSPTILLLISSVLLLPTLKLKASKIDKIIGVFIGLSVIYWMISFRNTGFYYSNLRVFEWILSALIINTLAKKPDLLKKGLTGFVVTAVIVGSIYLFIGGANRPGMMFLEGEVYGNPVSVALPLTISFLLLFTDNSKWINYFIRHKFFKYSMMILIAIMIILTTSRTNVIVLFLIILLGLLRMEYKKTVFIVIITVTSWIYVYSRLYGTEDILNWYIKIFDPEKSISSITTGRFDQWLLFFQIIGLNLFSGFGPGLGTAAYAKYSILSNIPLHGAGDNYEWHSIFLKLGIETGLIGLSIYMLTILWLMFKKVKELKFSYVPFVAFLSYLAIVLTVTGFDPFTGILFGLGSCDGRKFIEQTKTIG